MRALFADQSPNRREQAPAVRSSRSTIAKNTTNHRNGVAAAAPQHPSASSLGGGAAARRMMRAKAQTLSMQPTSTTTTQQHHQQQSNRRRNMAWLKYGAEDDRRSETSMNRTREHARQLAQRMSDEANNSPQHESFGNFAEFEAAAAAAVAADPRDRDGDNDSTFYSQASSFFDEDPFGNEDAPAVEQPPVAVRNERKDDSFVSDWPTEFESPKSMSTMPSNSTMQSSYAKQQHISQGGMTTPKQKPRTQQQALTQPRMPETPEIRPSNSMSSSTGAAARRRIRQQLKAGADATPPQSPRSSSKRYTSDSSLGSSQKNRLGDHVQNYSNRNRAGSFSNRSVSGRSVGSCTSKSGSDIFDHRSSVGAGFTFDAFGLDASQINAQVNEAMQDLAGSHPDWSFFQQDKDDDFANGRWNQQASPEPSRASTTPIAEEEKDEFVDGFRVTKPASLPVHIRPQHSPSASERSSLTSESNHDDGRVNLFKEKAAFASSRPRMIVRPSGPPSDHNLDADDLSVDRRGRRLPPVPDLGNQQIEFVGEDSEASYPQRRNAQHRYQQQSAHSDHGAPSDGGVASDTGVASGAESDVAVQSDHGRNTRTVRDRGVLPLEISSKKKSSTDTATTADTSGTYQMTYEEKKEEESKQVAAPTSTVPVRHGMAHWQQRDQAASLAVKDQETNVDSSSSRIPGGSRLTLTPTKAAATPEPQLLTRQSLEEHQVGLDQAPTQWPTHRPPKSMSPTKRAVAAPRSEGGAMLRSAHVNSVMERIQSQDVRGGDAKSDSGSPSPYQVKLRKTGLLSRPTEDDAERPVTPMAQKRSPRNGNYSQAHAPVDSAQDHLPQQSVSPSSQAVVPTERPTTPSTQISRAEEPRKLTYRERRELELQKQREEQMQKEEAQKTPEKDVASLIRKRIAANKKSVSPTEANSSNHEAQDKVGSLQPTTAPYSRHASSSSTSNEYKRESTPVKFNQQQPCHRQSSSIETDESRDLSIESAGSGVLEKLERHPNSAVSHLRLLQQLQSNSGAPESDLSPEARHRMILSVGSGDAEDHKKSSTPKATKMMLNAFLAGRSSIGEGGEVSSTAQSEGKANSGGAHSGLPALKDDPKYEKYFKMLKLGMPKEVVKHAMLRDGEDPSLMDEDPNKPAGIPLKDDPTYQKYFKMLRVGMPMEAVKHAMIRDGLDCSVMDQDHNLPVGKMQKKSDEDDELKEKDSHRRARLHWKTLRKVTSNSLWARLDQEVDMEQLDIDEQEFQELFQAEHDQVKPTKSTAANQAKGVTVRVIDPKRANNGGIILARLKMSHDDMADAVDRINEHALNAEQIEHIIEYLPSKEERKALETYMLEGGQDAAEKFEGLCECEKFMVSMMTVKHAKRKVRALLFKLQFEKCLDDILKDTLAIEAACDNLTHSVRLRQLLGIILNFGNRLNTAGNKRRKAGAFTLDSLLKLNQAKAFDRKTTFLNYIILIVQRNNEILLNFKDDLPAVFKADKVFWDQCLSDLEEVESQLENVRKIALYQAKQAYYRFRRRKKHDGDGDESLSEDDMNLSLEEEVEALRSTPIGMFTLSAIKYVSSLRDKVEETKAKYAHLLEYFGEEDKNRQPHELFSTVVQFCRDFDKAKEEVFALEKKKQREERKRQAGRPPTHSPAPPVDKKRQQMLKASSHQPNFSDAMRTSDHQTGKTPAMHQPEQLYSSRQQVNGYSRQSPSHSPPRHQQSQGDRMNHQREQRFSSQQQVNGYSHHSPSHSPPRHQQSQGDRPTYERASSVPHDAEPRHPSYYRQQESQGDRPTSERAISAPYDAEPRQSAYSRSTSMPVQLQPKAGGYSVSSSSPTGSLSAAARLKAKARIQQRTPPTPPEPDAAYYEAQSQAGHYEAQARAVAEAHMAGQDFSSQTHRPSPSQADHTLAPPPPHVSQAPVSSVPPSRSPRSSFRHKRRMEVRERIRQARS